MELTITYINLLISLLVFTRVYSGNTLGQQLKYISNKKYISEFLKIFILIAMRRDSNMFRELRTLH